MRLSIGRSLLERALAWCRSIGLEYLKVVADPNALGFYCAAGGKVLGQQPSVPVPRMLPVLRFYPLGRDLG